MSGRRSGRETADDYMYLGGLEIGHLGPQHRHYGASALSWRARNPASSLPLTFARAGLCALFTRTSQTRFGSNLILCARRRLLCSVPLRSTWSQTPLLGSASLHLVADSFARLDFVPPGALDSTWLRVLA